jgi:acetyl-CoA carboxylase carboxyltransferase component
MDCLAFTSVRDMEDHTVISLLKTVTVESGGAALPHQANVFPDKDHFGRIFYNMVPANHASS